MVPFPDRKVFDVQTQEYRPPKLVTTGTIAAELGVPVDRVCRILRARPYIRPRAYAGNVRLFDGVAIAQVRYELNRIAARREGGAR